MIARVVIHIYSGPEARGLHLLAEGHGALRQRFIVQRMCARIGVYDPLPVEKHRQVKLSVPDELQHIPCLLTGFLHAYCLGKEIRSHPEPGRARPLKVFEELIVAVKLAAAVIPAADAKHREAHAAVIHGLPVDIALKLRNVNAAAGLVFAADIGEVSLGVRGEIVLFKGVFRDVLLRHDPDVALAVEYLHHAVVGIVLDLRTAVKMLNRRIHGQQQGSEGDDDIQGPYAYFRSSFCLHAVIITAFSPPVNRLNLPEPT